VSESERERERVGVCSLCVSVCVSKAADLSHTHFSRVCLLFEPQLKSAPLCVDAEQASAFSDDVMLFPLTLPSHSLQCLLMIIIF